MQRTLLSTAMIVFAYIANGQLAPGTDAPLYQHLVEVNKEWRTMDPSPIGGERIVHFETDAQRIAMHLRMVRERLIARTTPTTAASTPVTQRTALLDRLAAYADRGLFPQNHVLPYRNPVFIDEVGTACAVGYLMIESGHRDLAERIRNEMNLAYVHDMKRSDVDAWAVAHGFNEDELAWIQPGYSPPLPWAGLGGGTNGEVKELLRLGSGDLLVAGTFTIAGDVAANRVAVYDGASYTELPGLPEGDIRTAIEFGGAIHIGGAFNGGSYDLATWTGSAWTLQAVFTSKYAEITDLCVHNGALHAAGVSSGFAGISYGVRRLDGSTWSVVGQELNGLVRTIESYSGALVCGGDFTADFLENDSSMVHVAVLDGSTWEQLGEGLNGRVFDLVTMNDTLYAGGDMVGEVATYFGLARIAGIDSGWEQLLPNIAWIIFSPLDGLTHVNALYVHEGSLYFGGEFYIVESLTEGAHLGQFLGEPDAVRVMAAFNGAVNDIDVFGANELVVGGVFTTNTFQATPYVASLDLTLGVSPGAGSSTWSVWPNPAMDRISVRADKNTTSKLTATLHDATGRMVRTVVLNGPTGTIDVHDLVNGSYTLTIEADGERGTAAFIKR